jgi:hypothetical protein
MKEKLKHKEAFELYYAMGEKRNITALAQELNYSRASIGNWSGKFKWQERILKRDEENGKKLAQKTDNTILKEKESYRKIIKQSINTFIEKLMGGEIKVTSVADLERLVKLDLLLMGEATDRTDSLASAAITDEAIKKAYEALYSDAKK